MGEPITHQHGPSGAHAVSIFVRISILRGSDLNGHHSAVLSLALEGGDGEFG